METKHQSSKSHSFAVKEHRNATPRSPVLEEPKTWHLHTRMHFLSIGEYERFVSLVLAGAGSVVGILKRPAGWRRTIACPSGLLNESLCARPVRISWSVVSPSEGSIR